MLDSIAYLPHELGRFWDANIGIKIQVLMLLAVLYFLGFYSAKLLQNRTWWKWALLLIFMVPFLSQIYMSSNIVFIGPVIIGLISGFMGGAGGWNPFGFLEGVTDFYYSMKQRRGAAETEAMYQEAEEVLRRSKEYEQQSRYNADRQNADSEAEKQRFREEMRRQRQEQNAQEEKPKQSASSSKSQESPKELNPSVLADAYEILGVQQGANLEECKKAYRLLMSLYHPDKVAQLSGSRRRQAEEETKWINAAWRQVKNRR